MSPSIGAERRPPHPRAGGFSSPATGDSLHACRVRFELRKAEREDCDPCRDEYTHLADLYGVPLDPNLFPDTNPET